MSKPISREKAIELLWEAGDLSYLLTDPQVDIKNGILADPNRISVVLCSRRLGKTFLMCTMAVEECLKKSNAVVKYAFPKQNSANKMLKPVMRKVLEDCPRHLKPVFMTAEKCYRFPNGSEIQISGTDNGNIENLRGGDSHLNIVDEAGFCSDLTYGVRSVLGPTTKITKGRTIMVSTPSRSENHDFIADWVLPYQVEGRIRTYTIYDNPQLNEEAIQEALSEYPDGAKDPMFRREYLCEIIRDTDKTILPSFNAYNESIIVTDKFDIPPYKDIYTSMDIGGSDLTVVLFGYYDFEEATLCILDEYVCDGTTNTQILAENIRNKEALHFSNPIDKSPEAPFMRVADNNNAILLTDLWKLHGLLFTKSKKDKREAAINALDVAIAQHKIKIHPRCTHLLYHVKNAEWNASRTDFKRLKDSPTGKIRGGHADGLPALLYMHRSVVKNRNPFPANYNTKLTSNDFESLHKKIVQTGTVADIFSKLLKKK
jgi:hypothetical protein